nr:hypothetical protein HK105_008175 [Polyrhizophydium stewartii]
MPGDHPDVGAVPAGDAHEDGCEDSYDADAASMVMSRFGRRGSMLVKALDGALAAAAAVNGGEMPSRRASIVVGLSASGSPTRRTSFLNPPTGGVGTASGKLPALALTGISQLIEAERPVSRHMDVRQQRRLQQRLTREENEKKEQRAVRLFDYIERCEREEKDAKRRLMQEYTHLQRLRIEARAEAIERMRTESEARRIETRHRLVAEARTRSAVGAYGGENTHYTADLLHSSLAASMIMTAATAAAAHKHRAGKLNNKGLFKSKAYREQANDVKMLREQYAHPHTLRRSEGTLNEAVDGGRTFANEVEFAAFKLKYNRSYSPTGPRAATAADCEQVQKRTHARLDEKLKMKQTISKHREKIKLMAAGVPNQHGIISAISRDYEAGFVHGRTERDPAWAPPPEAPYDAEAAAAQPPPLGIYGPRMSFAVKSRGGGLLAAMGGGGGGGASLPLGESMSHAPMPGEVTQMPMLRARIASVFSADAALKVIQSKRQTTAAHGGAA